MQHILYTLIVKILRRGTNNSENENLIRLFKAAKYISTKRTELPDTNWSIQMIFAGGYHPMRCRS